MLTITKNLECFCRYEVPDDANILNGRFVLEIKDEGSNKEIWKDIFIVQGHKDKMNNSLVQDISVARQYAIKRWVGIANILGFRLFSKDVTQAYIQSTEALNRDMLINTPKQFEIGPDELIKLLKPQYGLAESGDDCGIALRNHVEKEVGMKTWIFDAAIFYRKLGEALIGLCATYIDDS